MTTASQAFRELTTAAQAFRERILHLGSEASVLGIATDPDQSAATRSGSRTARPTVIFLNAGVLHRVGPHRLHVSLARLLADSGFASLRLDLSGIGDSCGVPGNLTFRASAIADTRAAMDQVSADSGTARFVLFGLCSGADNALATAQVDPRVSGLVLIDPPAYATGRARVRRVLERARQLRGASVKLRSCLRFLTLPFRQVARQLGQGSNAPGTPAAPGRQSPPRAEYGALLTQLLDRGVRILCVYSGAMGERYNHRDQIFEAFPALRGRLEVAFFPSANHVFTELAQRSELIATVRRWCGERFS
jgi:hypothetical protein